MTRQAKPSRANFARHYITRGPDRGQASCRKIWVFDALFVERRAAAFVKMKVVGLIYLIRFTLPFGRTQLVFKSWRDLSFRPPCLTVAR